MQTPQVDPKRTAFENIELMDPSDSAIASACPVGSALWGVATTVAKTIWSSRNTGENTATGATPLESAENREAMVGILILSQSLERTQGIPLPVPRSPSSRISLNLEKAVEMKKTVFIQYLQYYG